MMLIPSSFGARNNIVLVRKRQAWVLVFKLHFVVNLANNVSAPRQSPKRSRPVSSFFRAMSVVTVLATASLVVISSPNEAAAWGPTEPPRNYFTYLGACVSADQLDCVEGISAFINGAWVSGTLTARLQNPGSEFIDGRWVPIERDADWWGWYTREWSIPGLVNEDGGSLVQSHGYVAGPDTYDPRCKAQNPNSPDPCAPMVNLNVVASNLDGFKVPWESGSRSCLNPERWEESPYFGMCTRQGHLQKDVRFQVVIRTRWTLPSVVVSKTDQTTVSVERLPTSGASRVSIVGTPYETVGLGPGVDYRNDKNSSASWNDRIIKMQIIDGRIWRNGQYAACATQPPIVVADNSWAPSTPTFSRDDGLELNVSNSHFDTDGETPWVGRYNGTVPLATASCLWGTNLSSKSQFAASVYEDTTGATKAATTAVSVNDVNLKIDAYGFTFSSPTIRVSYVPPKSGSTIGKSPKVQTIVCKKGRLVKKVTSLRPRCPIGYRKA